ncbi:hypothetical protein FRC04_006021 [Tulasnella sp. 424]|nr:hypothetical protein FRC04_006021 [Tulasnella sp. 424]KAG8975610.1 hypothetical protein FRC05_005403 [Tulasnella sp. 425]
MAFTLRRNHATFLSLEPTNTNTNANLAPAPAQATSSAAPTVPATRTPAPLRRSRATFIPLEPAPTNTPAPPPPAQASSSTAPSVGPQPLLRSRATFIPLPLEAAPTNTAVPPPPAQASSSTAPRVAPQPLQRTHATLIPLEPAPTNTSLPAPSAQATSSTAPRVAPQPLSRSHATMISLAPPESTSATGSLPPSPTQATSSTTPPVPAPVPTPAPSAPTSAPIAELPFPLPEADMLYACNYACGPKLCDWCSKDRPPIGDANPIPHFIISTIIRHKLPHKFESLERIKDREIATGLVDPPNVGERDDAEYQPGGDFQPPAWGSDRARPKKSAMKRTSTRFAPYPDPSTRNALVRRSTEDIKAALDEAHANRIQSNYEGPVAIAIRNEISDLNIPGEAPFKWEPEYTGPPSDTLPEGDTLTSETTADADLMEEDLEDEAAVVEMVLTTQSKKRRYAEDDDDTTINSTPNASPTKKLRTTRRLPGSQLAAFSLPSFKLPSFTLTISFPSLSATLSFPSPIRSASPSATSTAVATDSSSSDGEPSSSPRRQRVGKKKLRFLLSDPTSNHPKFGIRDNIYFHHRRLNSTSKNGRSQKKSKVYVPQDKETWTPEEIEFAALGKEDWDEMRKTSLERKTSLKSLQERVKRSEAIDASAERFQKLVDKYEEDCKEVDLTGVRARFIRPRRNEIPREKNKEAMPRLGPLDEMRRHYPAFDHPAWDGVDAAAIAAWTRSDHYKLVVNEVMHSVAREEKGKGKANAEPDEATEIATIVDEDEEKMRREFLAAEVDEVEAPRRSGSGSAWGAAPGGEGDGGLNRQMAMSAVDFEGQWSAPSAHHPTDSDAEWSTPGAGPSTWASSF